MLKGTKICDILPAWDEAIQNASIGRNADKLAAIYANPDAMAQLRKLRLMTPDSALAIRLATEVLGNAGYVSSGPGARPMGQQRLALL